MSRSKDLYSQLLKIPHITDMFPLLYVKENQHIVSKDGTESVVLELNGLDYSGMRNDIYDKLYNVRKRVFEKESPFYRLDILSQKNRVEAKDKIDPDVNNPILKMTKLAWRDQFNVLYRSKHYLVISVNNASVLSKVGSLVSDDYDIDKEVELNRLVDEIKSDLVEYSPRLLSRVECSSFYATQLNGRETFLNAVNWDQSLCNQKINFDAKNNYCTYGEHGDTVYSGWLSISRYSEEITRHTLERIFKLPYRFNVYQSFKTYTKKAALNKIKDNYDHLNKWGGINEFYDAQLNEFHAMVSSDKTTLVDHTFAIEILADSLEELNNSVRVLSNAMTSDGQMLLYRETRNIEALFWSRFPTMSGFNLRGRDISSENAAHLATFNCVGEGFDTCGFGDRPVTLFKTEEGGQFSFTFHQTGELKPDVLGHSLFIGGTGTGKTTMISFLLSQCLSSDNFTAICFDRLGGLKVFTDMFDGEYLDFPEDVQMNPFQLDDTPVNRMFLFQWLKRLGRIGEDDISFNDALNDVINANFKLNKDDRNFAQLMESFGRDGDVLFLKFSPWFPDGIRKEFFNGVRDSFSFKKDIITFDATFILDQPEILPNITDYVFHQIMQKVSSDVVPHVVFFDEAPRYFQDPIFAKKMLESIAEIRKKAGVCVLAAQNPTQLLKLDKNIGSEVVNGMAHIVCYPNPTGTKAEYMEFLGFNETEYNWIVGCNDKHKVLVKNRSNDSSVILDVNLSALNTKRYDLLRCFDSGASAVKRLKDLKDSDPINWKMRYLKK